MIVKSKRNSTGSNGKNYLKILPKDIEKDLKQIQKDISSFAI